MGYKCLSYNKSRCVGVCVMGDYIFIDVYVWSPPNDEKKKKSQQIFTF